MKTIINRRHDGVIYSISISLNGEEIYTLLNSSIAIDDYVSMLSSNFEQDISDLEKNIENTG